jgi:hypothetical protein
MDKFWFLFLLSFSTRVDCGKLQDTSSELFKSNAKVSFLASAISQLVNHHFLDKSLGFEVLLIGNDTSTTQSILEEFGKSIEIPYRQRKVSDCNGFCHLDGVAVLLSATSKDYQAAKDKIIVKFKHEEFLYLLTYSNEDNNGSISEDLTINRSEQFEFHRFFNQYFLKFNEGSITLSTYSLFQQPECRKSQLVKVNEFSFSAQKWQHDKFSVDKFNDLNQCEIAIEMVYPQNEALQVDFDADKNATNFRGYLTKISEIISQKLNFSFIYQPNKLNFLMSPNKQNKVLETFNYQFLIKNDLRYELSSVQELSQENANAYTVTKEITHVDNVILISRFKPYSLIEKLVISFEPEVWYWLIGSLAVIALASSIIIVFASTTVRNFVFGSRVITPLLNMM